MFHMNTKQPTKVCSKCQVEKPLSEFGKDKNRKKGIKYLCKKCFNEEHKNWRTKNPEKIKENNKQFKMNYPHLKEGVSTNYTTFAV